MASAACHLLLLNTAFQTGCMPQRRVVRCCVPEGNRV